MPSGAGKRAKDVLRRVLPPSATAALRRSVLKRKPALHSLEYHVTDHCNLNCKGCGHFSCISPAFFALPAEYDRDMARLAELLDNIDVITLLGGEPLLHLDVLEFVKSARRAFPRAQVHLVTNGILLPKMPEEFWKTLAAEGVRINVSNYPIERQDELIRTTAEKYGVEIFLTDARESFYCIALDESGENAPTSSRASCLELANCPFLRDGRIFPCAYPPLVFALEERFGVELPVSDADSINIFDDIDGFAISEFLARPIPFCRFCNFDKLRYFDWGRTSRCLEEWM
jgi:hypothetical protein